LEERNTKLLAGAKTKLNQFLLIDVKIKALAAIVLE
jgi:hypothetical protein